MALWDLAGHAAGLPVHKLLGGKVRDRVRVYNGGVRELNTKIKTFPNTLFVRGLGFSERDFFEVAEPSAIAEPPRVQF